MCRAGAAPCEQKPEHRASGPGSVHTAPGTSGSAHQGLSPLICKVGTTVPTPGGGSSIKEGSQIPLFAKGSSITWYHPREPPPPPHEEVQSCSRFKSCPHGWVIWNEGFWVFFFLLFNYYLFMCLRLCWVFAAACRHSLVAVCREHSLPLLGAQALGSGLRSCVAGA